MYLYACKQSGHRFISSQVFGRYYLFFYTCCKNDTLTSVNSKFLVLIADVSDSASTVFTFASLFDLFLFDANNRYVWWAELF